jgi:hypothetical protein
MYYMNPGSPSNRAVPEYLDFRTTHRGDTLQDMAEHYPASSLVGKCLWRRTLVREEESYDHTARLFLLVESRTQRAMAGKPQTLLVPLMLASMSDDGVTGEILLDSKLSIQNFDFPKVVQSIS